MSLQNVQDNIQYEVNIERAVLLVEKTADWAGVVYMNKQSTWLTQLSLVAQHAKHMIDLSFLITQQFL